MDRLEICDRNGAPTILINEAGEVVDLKKDTIIYKIGSEWVVAHKEEPGHGEEKRG